MPVESARGSWAGQETEGLHLPRERSERRNNLALKGQFCPPLSKGLRRKQSKNQIVSCPCCSLIWNLGQLPCSSSVFLSVEWEESLRFFFLREILEKKKGVFRFEVLLSLHEHKHDSNSVKENRVSFWAMKKVHKENHSFPRVYQVPTVVPKLCPSLRGIGRDVKMGSCPQSRILYAVSLFLWKWKHRSTPKK